jgi:VPDSG-CTERM motif
MKTTLTTVCLRRLFGLLWILSIATLIASTGQANIIITPHEDSATRLYFHLDWSDPGAIDPVFITGEGGSYIDAWTAPRDYGWEVIARVDPVALGGTFGYVAAWSINFSAEIFNIDPTVPREIFGLGVPGFAFFDSDLHGADFVFGTQLPVPDTGSTLALLALGLGGVFAFHRRRGLAALEVRGSNPPGSRIFTPPLRDRRRDAS